MSNRNEILDRKKLKSDLKKWQGLEFISLGILGIIGLHENAYAILDSFLDIKVYHIAKKLYFIFMKDINKGLFNSVYHELNQEKNTCPEMKIYKIYSNDEPEVREMVEHLLKIIQVNESAKIFKSTSNQLLSDLEKQRYEIYLQPKMDYQNSKIMGAEALVRYHKNEEILPPSYFISKWEEKGLIYYIDIFVFRKVCELLERWKQENRDLYSISLNFSRTTLLNIGLINKMNEIADTCHIDHSMIEIEITETIGSIGKDFMKEVGDAIRSNGYGLSLDDFGVEYSNAIVLSLLPFQTLKLDKCIAKDILSNSRLQIIIREVVLMCEKLNVKLIAEGIETNEELDLIRQIGCHNIQGYLVSKPLNVQSYEMKFNQMEG